MQWRKLGLIFEPDRSKPWMRSHAALPTPLQLDGSLYRVFFSSRDGENRSHVGYFDLDLTNPTEVLAVSPEPVLRPGAIGGFDWQGVYAASAVRDGDRVHLYTIGWNKGDPAPMFYASIGLAISRDDGTSFEKLGRSPIMSRSEHDPCLVTSPVVLKEEGLWRMWYVSGLAWSADSRDGGLHSSYHIKYAESDDGVRWQREGRICIDLQDPDERNIARTCVLRSAGGYEAWYGYARGSGYRLGFARSKDGLVWDRCDLEAGIGLSAEGWDSQALAYPYVIDYEQRRFLFYNGNGFGRDGIGLAVTERPLN